MIYMKNLLESLGLMIELPMVMHVDNKGTVDSVNGYSVVGHMRHVNVEQCFLHKLKESKVLIVKWILIKNLDGPLFNQCAD